MIRSRSWVLSMAGVLAVFVGLLLAPMWPHAADGPLPIVIGYQADAAWLQSAARQLHLFAKVGLVPVAQGIADPARVAIIGTSYGGYSALVGVTFTPEKFACAVELVGVSNLVTFLNTIPDYWQTWKSVWAVRVGDYKSEGGRKFLEERSPLNRADRIARPLLIGQGANDVRVKAAESEQIVAAMQRHGIPVTYIYYPDEGHGLLRPGEA